MLDDSAEVVGTESIAQLDRGEIRLRAAEKRQAANEYATTAHFCRIFQEDMQSLYLLAFLLTANHVTAAQCFIASMEDALNDKGVFEDFVRSWSRRVVIKKAIHMIVPTSAQCEEQADRWAEGEDGSVACVTIDAVAQLPCLNRIVFVMSVLERYSEQECALLMDCSVRDVQRARVRALQQLPALYPPATANAEDFHGATAELQREYERSRP